MEDKLNDLMNEGDYYSAHQLILSLTKRKAKLGKINDAVEFVKNGVTRLCQASQFASASDAAMSIFEYATDSHFVAMKEIFSQLLMSPDAQYWKKFINEMGKQGITDNIQEKTELLDLIINSNITGNLEKLTYSANLILQLSGNERLVFLKKLSIHLASERTCHDFVNIHIYFLVELSVNLMKEGQFYDNEYFLRMFSEIINAKEADQSETISPIEIPEFKLFNFCLLLNYLCQRKSPPKSLFVDILNHYLPDSDCRTNSDLARIRSLSESTLGQVFWPAPKPRPGQGSSAPPDLMSMLQGLLGPQMKR